MGLRTLRNEFECASHVVPEDAGGSEDPVCVIYMCSERTQVGLRTPYDAYEHVPFVAPEDAVRPEDPACVRYVCSARGRCWGRGSRLHA